MTNLIALLFALALAALFLADSVWLHWNLPVVLGTRFVHLVEWVQFWR